MNNITEKTHGGLKFAVPVMAISKDKIEPPLYSEALVFLNAFQTTSCVISEGESSELAEIMFLSFGQRKIERTVREPREKLESLAPNLRFFL